MHVGNILGLAHSQQPLLKFLAFARKLEYEIVDMDRRQMQLCVSIALR